MAEGLTGVWGRVRVFRPVPVGLDPPPPKRVPGTSVVSALLRTPHEVQDTTLVGLPSETHPQTPSSFVPVRLPCRPRIGVEWGVSSEIPILKKDGVQNLQLTNLIRDSHSSFMTETTSVAVGRLVGP